MLKIGRFQITTFASNYELNFNFVIPLLYFQLLQLTPAYSNFNIYRNMKGSDDGITLVIENWALICFTTVKHSSNLAA